MAKAPLSSIRSNSMPAGGPTSTQPVPPNATPADIAAIIDEMEPVISRFRENSTDMSANLNKVKFNDLGEAVQTRISSVGLGYRTVSEHQVELKFSNSGAAAETVDFSKHFPYNLLAQTSVSINGGTVVYSASGPAGLAVIARGRRGFFNPPSGSQGLSAALCRLSFGAGLTPTASSSFTLSGYDSMSIAAGTTDAVLTITYYTVEKLAYSKDSLLGALPLQNNSVYAQLNRQITGQLIGSTQKAPFYGAGADVTATLGSYNVNTTYKFWSVPSDPALYQDMVNNSFQVLENSGLSIASTGSESLQFDLPQNQYLTAAHLFMRDSTDAPLSFSDLSRMLIQYNAGSVKPILKYAGRGRVENYLDYGADVSSIPGYFLWDGDVTSDDINHTDESGWIDTYTAATPQIIGDILGTVSAPVSYSVTRESVVAGAVKEIG